jgi:PEP-CTERM motif
VLHRWVIAVIGMLAISTSAAAGPIKLDTKAPSFEVAELRALDAKELRALFFRGAGARNAAASCADCLSAGSSLTAHDREGKSQYKASFPFTAARLFTKPAANRSSSKRQAARVPDLLAGPVAGAADVVAGVTLPGGGGVAPLDVVSPAAVPEPNTLALIGTGVAGAVLLRRRRQRSHQV